jgi:hypothetical protein
MRRAPPLRGDPQCAFRDVERAAQPQRFVGVGDIKIRSQPRRETPVSFSMAMTWGRGVTFQRIIAGPRLAFKCEAIPA